MLFRAVQTVPLGPTDQRKILVAFGRNPLKFYRDLYQEYGDFTYFQLGPKRVYVASRPDLLRKVLVELNDKMARTELTHNTLGKFIGLGLTVSHGDLHRRERRTIQPVFTPAWITSYTDLMIESTLQQIESWQDGEIINIAAEMMDLTMNIVYRTIFGNRINQADQDAKDAITLLQKYSGEMLIGSVTISEEQCQAAKVKLETIVDELIEEHRQTEQSSFLSLLLDATDPETGERISDEQIRSEAINMYIAGQETSANALSWTWNQLADHPDIQTTLHQEIDTVLNGVTVSLDLLPRLTYTEQVIKESMRISPPAWLIGRRPTEEVEIDGYVIDPDATIAICPYAFHRNPNVFPDPERFDPERFSSENEKQIPRYAYLPFGAGTHICIGQPFAMLETSIILAVIAQRFWIEPMYDQPVQSEPLMTLRPKHGIKVRITKRS